MKRRAALAGIRVLDLADASGAFCGKLLAGMGADVIKIEPPPGCPTRRIRPLHPVGTNGKTEDADRSLFFWHFNLNKRSVVLDLNTTAGREHFERLAATADAIVETFPPGHMEGLGLGFQHLRSFHPGLVVTSITPFGQTGPLRSRRGCDLTAQAAGGMLFLNGFPEETPLQGYGLPAYHAASTYAAIGTVLALLARNQSGKGQHIDVSLHEAVVSYVEHATSIFRQEGGVAQRQGGLHSTGLFRVGRCRDGHVLHGTMGDWTSLAEWVQADGGPGELAHAEWQDAEHRRRQSVRLLEILDAWAAAHRVADIVEGAQLRRLPYAPVSRLFDLLHHPQLEAREFFVPVHHPELDAPVTYAGGAAKFGATPWEVRCRPPLLGEHTAVLLDEVAVPHQRVAVHPNAMTGAPLQGVRVIDFTWVHAGPVATRVLADHGAEVIKIERPDAFRMGDRRTGLPGNLNRGKHSVVLDMNDPRGVQLARELIRRSDVVVDNFSPRVLDNWGLDGNALRSLRADLVSVRLSAFGMSGPHRDRVAYAPTLHAQAGHTFMMRLPAGEPAGWGLPYSDLAAGCAAAFAVLVALWHRQRTGEGQLVDLSQFENLVSLNGPDLMQLINGALPSEVGGNDSREGPAAPHGVYRCADCAGQRPPNDRWCAIAVFGDEEWLRFVNAIGAPLWTRAAHFATEQSRCANRSLLDRHVEEWTAERTAEDVADLLQSSGLCAAAVADASDLHADAHLRARGYWLPLPVPGGETVDVDVLPCRLFETPARVTAPGPLPGEHTDAVLGGILGLPAARIASLRREGVIA